MTAAGGSASCAIASSAAGGVGWCASHPHRTTEHALASISTRCVSAAAVFHHLTGWDRRDKSPRSPPSPSTGRGGRISANISASDGPGDRRHLDAEYTHHRRLLRRLRRLPDLFDHRPPTRRVARRLALGMYGHVASRAHRATWHRHPATWHRGVTSLRGVDVDPVRAVGSEWHEPSDVAPHSTRPEPGVATGIRRAVPAGVPTGVLGARADAPPTVLARTVATTAATAPLRGLSAASPRATISASNSASSAATSCAWVGRWVRYT